VETSLYFREATAEELERTLLDAGACCLHKGTENSAWRLPIGVRIDVLKDLGMWEMELTIESLNEWRAPFERKGWTPTIAAIVQWDRNADAAHAARTLAQSMLQVHAGIADPELDRSGE